MNDEKNPILVVLEKLFRNKKKIDKLFGAILKNRYQVTYGNDVYDTNYKQFRFYDKGIKFFKNYLKDVKDYDPPYCKFFKLTFNPDEFVKFLEFDNGINFKNLDKNHFTDEEESKYMDELIEKFSNKNTFYAFQMDLFDRQILAIKEFKSNKITKITYYN